MAQRPAEIARQRESKPKSGRDGSKDSSEREPGRRPRVVWAMMIDCLVWFGL